MAFKKNAYPSIFVLFDEVIVRCHPHHLGKNWTGPIKKRWKGPKKCATQMLLNRISMHLKFKSRRGFACFPAHFQFRYLRTDSCAPPSPHPPYFSQNPGSAPEKMILKIILLFKNKLRSFNSQCKTYACRSTKGGVSVPAETIIVFNINNQWYLVSEINTKK